MRNNCTHPYPISATNCVKMAPKHGTKDNLSIRYSTRIAAPQPAQDQQRALRGTSRKRDPLRRRIELPAGSR